MTWVAVSTLLYLLDEAFDSGDQSLLVNLRSLKDDDWFWFPAGWSRCAYEIVWHVGFL
jgi:hypothetical protein